MSEATANRKFEDFLERLLDATYRGDVEWEDSADEAAFFVTLRHGSVHIERRYDFDEDDRQFPVFKAYLYNTKGRLAEDIGPREMRDDALLSRLFDEARRRARKADSLLDQVTADLQTKGAG